MTDTAPAPLPVDTLLGTPFHFPDDFKSWLADYVATNIPMIPYSQIFGAHLNLARSSSFIETSEAHVGATYGDLATVGPEIKNVVDGNFLILFGVFARPHVGISINGSTPSDDESLKAQESGPSLTRAIMKTMTGNNVNSFKMQYKDSGDFANRWMVAIRVGPV